MMHHEYLELNILQYKCSNPDKITYFPKQVIYTGYELSVSE